MLIRLKDLKSLSVEDSEAGRHALIDLFVEPQALRVTHAIMRLGRWFERSQCAVAIGAMAKPDVEAGLWPGRFDEAGVGSPAPGGTVVCRMPGEDALLPTDVPGDRVRSLSSLIGAPVVARDGEAGRVMDLVIDPDDWSVPLLILGSGELLNEHQRVVPRRLIDRIDWDEPSLGVRADAAAVERSPDLHEFEGDLQGKWYNGVLAYYGIG